MYMYVQRYGSGLGLLGLVVYRDGSMHSFIERVGWLLDRLYGFRMV
jgi:hypothetical protein